MTSSLRKALDQYKSEAPESSQKISATGNGASIWKWFACGILLISGIFFVKGHAENAVSRVVVIALLLAAPVTSFFVAKGVQYKLDSDVRSGLKEKFADAPEKLAAITLDGVCRNPDIRAKLGDACGTSDNLELMKTASLVLSAGAVVLVVGIWLAGLMSQKNRLLLLLLFAPGLYLTVCFVIVFVAVNAALLIGCIWYGESALIGRVHIGIMAGIGIGALAGSLAMIQACWRTLQRAETTVIGKKLLEKEQPDIWKFVRDTAARLKAKVPQQIVVGLDPNFYVTEANVICLDGTMKGRTMYLSLPLCRLLTKDELLAVIGHELGHFTGQDTKFSLRFFPIYRGAAESLASLGRQHVDSKGKSSGAVALAVLPAQIILGFFLSEFAKAENGISRYRELMADKKAMEVGGAKTMASALVKIHAFTPYWPGLVDFMKKALSEGKSIVNGSALFATVVAENAKPEAFDGLDKQRMVHPTDSHPPLGDRLKELGVSLADVIDVAIVTAPGQPAVGLVQNYEQIEKELSEFKQALMVRSGEATLPPDDPKAEESDSQAA